MMRGHRWCDAGMTRCLLPRRCSLLSLDQLLPALFCCRRGLGLDGGLLGSRVAAAHS